MCNHYFENFNDENWNYHLIATLLLDGDNSAPEQRNKPTVLPIFPHQKPLEVFYNCHFHSPLGAGCLNASLTCPNSVFVARVLTQGRSYWYLIILYVWLVSLNC